MILQRLFLEHPRSLGESYMEHQRHAFGYGVTMMAAGFACLLHGLLPAIFVDTGSRSVSRLHEHMVRRRGTLPKTVSAAH